MKITVYNLDGSVKDTESVDYEIPEYIERYDEQHSFLNITAEEIEVINSNGDSFQKTMLLKRLANAIEHDYNNYREIYDTETGFPYIGIETIMREAESDPQIIIGDRVLSSILRIYGSRTRYSKTEIIQDDDFFSKETCTKEEFLIYINKVEHQRVSEHGNIISSKWVNVILYHALKSAVKVTMHYDEIDMETRFFVSLQNLINRYYYSLKNMERTVSWMPAELKYQIGVLTPFVKRIDTRRWEEHTFDEQRFLIKLINALYLIQEKNRSDVYRIATIVSGYDPYFRIMKKGNLCFSEMKPIKREVKNYEIRLYNPLKKCRGFEINDNDICKLRISSDENNILSELKKCLVTIYNEYVGIFHEKWENNIKTDSKIYFNKQTPYHEDWLGFYHHKIEKYRMTVPDEDELYKPQQCFYLLLCNNVSPDKELCFSKDVIIDLVDILKIESCDKQKSSFDNQVGLYECMFKINYIKKHIGQVSPSDEAVSRAMKYLEPLFATDSEHVEGRFREKLRMLMKSLLSYQGIKPQMTTVTPNGFTGGFNLQLVYNILGLLRTTLPKILINGAEKIDDCLRDNAAQNGIIHKDDNKIRKGLMYNKCNTYNKYYAEIEKITYSFISKILEGSN